MVFIADLDTSEITSALIRDKVDSESNHNYPRRIYMTAKSILKDFGLCQILGICIAKLKMFLGWLQD